MFSKFTIALCLASIAGLAVANPVRRDAIDKRQIEIGETDAPYYCQVLGNEAGAFLWRYRDVSKGKSFCSLLCSLLLTDTVGRLQECRTWRPMLYDHDVKW
jgi:hypothetical protein